MQNLSRTEQLWYYIGLALHLPGQVLHLLHMSIIVAEYGHFCIQVCSKNGFTSEKAVRQYQESIQSVSH